MVTEQELLTLELKTLQRLQYILNLADTAASSHILKSDLRNLLADLDQLESQIQILSTQRGWDLQEIEPITRYLSAFRFRCRVDPAIAEYMIRLYTRDSITLLKFYNRWDRDDPSIRSLTQKILDNCAIGIRQMQPFL